MKASHPDVTSESDQNTNITAPSESQEAILHPNRSSTAEDGSPVSESPTDSLSDLRRESSSKSSISSSPAGPVDEPSSSDSSDDFDIFSESQYPKDIVFPAVTLSAFTETGQAESSIKVPKQRSYTGRRPVISSSLADTPCATLGVQGVLDKLNASLRTSYTLDVHSLRSLLEDCIERNSDFGTAYGRLRPVWYTKSWSTIRDKLRRREEGDRKSRRKALVGNRIVNPSLPPRRVWDLYSNRVVPWWIARKWPRPISHAWVDEQDRIDVWTPTNGYEWPVPIPKDSSLNLIRIEMLNLGVEYVWLDVLCLRQKEGPREDLRVEEWRLDVPTVGGVFAKFGKVVIYLSGLGRPLRLKDGDLDSYRCWFRRAWSLQEFGDERIFAGDTPDGPMHAKPIDEGGNYETARLTRFHEELASLQGRRSGTVDTNVKQSAQRERQSPEHARAPRPETREVTIRASVETGIPASSIKIPLQRDHRGTKPVIKSSLSNTSYNSVDEVLRQLNAILGTLHDMTPSLRLLLQSWIDRYDFGAVYGRLRPGWYTADLMTIRENFEKDDDEDREMRRKAAEGGQTIKAQTPPRRVWDLYSNRVVPQWLVPRQTAPWAISHAWMHEDDRVDLQTPINGHEWPVPIPTDASLDLIRIELLNMGAEYVWLDVLCLRQKGGVSEDEREQEWPLDVPTIGYVYLYAKMVVYYFSGLGRALSTTVNDRENTRWWFKRAWTLQEISQHRIYAGDTDGHLTYANAPDNRKEVVDFQNQLVLLNRLALERRNVFTWCRYMRERDSVYPTDKVVGLAFPLRSETIPAYDQNRSDEDTWIILVESMAPDLRGQILFLCPEGHSGSWADAISRTWLFLIGTLCRRHTNIQKPDEEPEGAKPPKWAPSWKQITYMTLPSMDNIYLNEPVMRTGKAGENLNESTTNDFYKGFCIETARVRGLAWGKTSGDSTAIRHGTLIIDDHTGTPFNIVAMHNHPIPEGTYTLIGSQTLEYWVVGHRREPGKWFEKVSVFRIPDKEERTRLEKLKVLRLLTNSTNYLI